jgi:hypothetical protein
MKGVRYSTVHRLPNAARIRRVLADNGSVTPEESEDVVHVKPDAEQDGRDANREDWNDDEAMSRHEAAVRDDESQQEVNKEERRKKESNNSEFVRLVGQVEKRIEKCSTSCEESELS